MFLCGPQRDGPETLCEVVVVEGPATDEQVATVRRAAGDVTCKPTRQRAQRPPARLAQTTGRALPEATVEPEIRHPAVVAAEQLVASVAGQKHLDPVLMDGTGDRGDGDPRRICSRYVETVDPVLK